MDKPIDNIVMVYQWIYQPQNTAVFVFQQRSRGPAMRSMRHSPAPSQAEADRAQGFASPSRQASTWKGRPIRENDEWPMDLG